MPATKGLPQAILRQLVKEMGAVIRFQRHRLGMTQEQLADAVGISNSHLSQVESGKKVPSLELLVKLTLALKMTVQQLINAATTLTESDALQAKVEMVNFVGDGLNKALRILGDDTGHVPTAN